MNDIRELRAIFLEVVGVKTKEDATRESINAAVATRGGGKFYATADSRKRTALKEGWKKLICDEAERYVRGETLSEQTLDDEHCEAIGRIAEKAVIQVQAMPGEWKAAVRTIAKGFQSLP
jgi:hypothetical protein